MSVPVCTGHASTHGPWSPHVNIFPSSFWTAFQGGGGKKKKNPILLISYPSSSLNHDPPFFSPCLFFFSLILLIPFLAHPHPSSFSVLKYNQECGKLEGDLVLCPSQGDRGRETLGFCPAWSPGWGVPPGSCELALWVAGPFQLPQRSLGSANGVPAVQTARLHLLVKRKHFFASNHGVIIQITAREAN